MSRRKGQPFNGHKTTAVLVNDENGKQVKKKVVLGRAPQKLTKGLKRHLRKVAAQNPQEAERQLSMVGASMSQIEKPKR